MQMWTLFCFFHRRVYEIGSEKINVDAFFFLSRTSTESFFSYELFLASVRLMAALCWIGSFSTHTH